MTDLMEHKKSCNRGHFVMKLMTLLFVTPFGTTDQSQRDSKRTQIVTLPQKTGDKRYLSMDTHSMSTAAQNVFLTSPVHRFRLQRAVPRGCQLGTCQLHNLANTLYRIGQPRGKEESKKTRDPKGYGR
uniref:Adrenomedullin n=1 Tax=Denticeps clupeoides TaxID=299321 RepID=A0AAY4C275_9TELE